MIVGLEAWVQGRTSMRNAVLGTKITSNVGTSMIGTVARCIL